MTCWRIEVYPQELCLRLDPMFGNARLHEDLNCVIQLVLGKFSFTSHLFSLTDLNSVKNYSKSVVNSHPIYTVETSSITQLLPPYQGLSQILTWPFAV